MNKIDSVNNSDLLFTQPIMKPVYSTNIELLCGVIEYNNKTYLVDLSDKDRIINFNKTFVFANEDDLYPSYSYNYKRFTYLANLRIYFFLIKNINMILIYIHFFTNNINKFLFAEMKWIKI